MADRKKLGKGLSALLSSGSASNMSNLLGERAVDKGSVLGEEDLEEGRNPKQRFSSSPKSTLPKKSDRHGLPRPPSSTQASTKV